jgi:hypothetical protein
VAYSALVALGFALNTRDKPGLLFAMMRTFASDQSRIAFEGNLAGTELFRLLDASHEEIGNLKRATIAPPLDFVVLPLPPSRVPEIEKAIRSKIAFAGYKGIIHVQIERQGEIAFGAFDNFGPETVFVYGALSEEALDDLVGNRILKSYSRASPKL